MQIVTRSEWGARSARSRTPMSPYADPVIHYNGPAMNLAGKGLAAERAAVRGIQRYHLDDKGWADIAYSFLIGPSGAIYEGRGKGIRSAANGSTSQNKARYSIMFLVGEGEQISSEMLASANALIKDLGYNAVVGHRDVRATACPGNVIYDLIAKGVFNGQDYDPVVPDPGPAIQPGNLVLAQGSKGTSVRKLQKALNVMFGSGLVEDGDFGPGTKKALALVQKKFGLVADGVYGPVTKQQLEIFRSWVNGVELP